MDQCVASSAPNSPTSISAASDPAPAGELGTVGSMPGSAKPEPQLTQRLVRTLCPHCKGEEDVDEEAWALVTQPFKVKPLAKVFAPQGCLECRDTGYMGSMGIYEILPMTSKIQSRVSADADLDALRKTGFADGMRSLRLSGAQKVGAGVTTIAEVLRVSPASQDL